MFGIELAAGFIYKTAKDSFAEWAKKEGVGFIKSCVDKGLHTEGFSLLGKEHLVKDNLWKSVETEAEQPALAAALSIEADEYLKLPGLLAENSDNLPNKSCLSKNIRAVPRRAVSEAAKLRLKRSIGSSQLLRQSQADSNRLVTYFIDDLVAEMARQYGKAYTNESPMKIADVRETTQNWVVIGLDSVYPWPDGDHPGHYLLFNESFAAFKKFSRDDKKAIENALIQLEGGLGKLDALKKAELIESIIFRVESKYSSSPTQWKMV